MFYGHERNKGGDMKTLAIALAALAVGAVSAEADVVYSSFGPRDETAPLQLPVAAGGTSIFGPHTQATQVSAFMPNADFRLEQIELAICGTGGPLDVSLRSDNNGGSPASDFFSHTPGDVIETFRLFTATCPPPPTPITMLTPLIAQSVLKPLLHGRTPYWLVVAAGDSQEVGSWAESVTRGLVAEQFGSCSVSGQACESDSDCPSREICAPNSQWFSGNDFQGAYRVNGVPPAAPVCGNGSIEGSEQCDDGNTVGGDGCDADCRVECAVVLKPKLTITKLNTPPTFFGAGSGGPGSALRGGATLTFQGTTTLRSPVTSVLDPLTTDTRVLVEGSAGILLDLTMPGFSFDGVAGWTVNNAGTKWTYRQPPEYGAAKAVIQDKSKVTPGAVKFTVSVSTWYSAATPADLPLSAHIIFNPPLGQCAVASFPGPKPAPRCTFNTSGSKLTCK